MSFLIRMELFKRYLVDLGSKIPLCIYVVLLLILFISTSIIIRSKRISDKRRKIAGVLFIEYFTLLYCATVFIRDVADKQSFKTRPFWSYIVLYNGEKHPDVLLPQMIMNVVIFIPLGFLLGVAFRNTTWWETVIVGGSASISIELIQLLTSRGTAEYDDVMHNTLGCLIGYGLYSMLRIGYEKVCKRNVESLKIRKLE